MMVLLIWLFLSRISKKFGGQIVSSFGYRFLARLLRVSDFVWLFFFGGEERRR